MNKRIARTSTLAALALLFALLGCAAAEVQATRPATPVGANPGTDNRLKVHQVAQTTTLPYGDIGPATVTCPQGEYALSGGWSLPNQGDGARVIAARIDGNSWGVSVVGPPLTNNGNVARTSPGTGLQVTVYAECLANASGAVLRQQVGTFDVSPSSPNNPLGNSMELVCDDANSVPVGIGFDFGPSQSFLDLQGISAIGLGAPEGDSWTLYVRNHDIAPHTATLYVSCLEYVTVPYPVPQDPNNVHFMQPNVEFVVFPDPNTFGAAIVAGKSADVQQVCPSGTLVAGGGLYYQGRGLGSLTVLRATSTGWEGALYAATAAGDGLYPHVVAACLSFSIGPYTPPPGRA
jgi:hypothetical protein